MGDGTVTTSRPLPQIDPANVDWSELDRPVPAWYSDAKFGIMVHWGAYSVPAWAEPTGELGTVSSEVWFPHNPYAEWYWNTIRFDDSPARQFHRDAHADAPYDDFLDAWVIDAFEPDQWMELSLKQVHATWCRPRSTTTGSLFGTHQGQEHGTPCAAGQTATC